MRVERLIMMLIRPLISKGLNKGIDMTMGKGKDPKDMTPEERQSIQNAKGMAKRAQKMARMGRKIGRF